MNYLITMDKLKK